MTAWTAIVVLIWTIGKCSLDMVGMEYGADAQHFTDQQFVTAGVWFTITALTVDVCNFIAYWRDKS